MLSLSSTSMPGRTIGPDGRTPGCAAQASVAAIPHPRTNAWRVKDFSFRV
jgi:hypothetical protein